MELLQIARKMERKAEADEVMGEYVPVSRKMLNETVDALRWAYTAVSTPPDLDAIAAEKVDGLQRLCRWFTHVMDLDDEELARTMPPELLADAAWLWAPKDESGE